MSAGEYNLAIETTGPTGSVSLGRGDQLLASLDMPPQQRHAVDLMPTIDHLCRRHSVTPRQIGQVYLSIGPGSFTGLRIGVATAKTLAQVLGAKVVALPTLQVVAQNAPPAPNVADATAALAVCLNLKRDTVYAGLFAWRDNAWQPAAEPVLLTLSELLERWPRPLMLLGDPLPLPEASPAGANAWPADVTVLPAAMAVGRSEQVWKLGRAAAARGAFTDPLALVPLYIREPEAVELWNQRHANETVSR